MDAASVLATAEKYILRLGKTPEEIDTFRSVEEPSECYS
jgi:hypothetical protein